MVHNLTNHVYIIKSLHETWKGQGSKTSRLSEQEHPQAAPQIHRDGSSSVETFLNFLLCTSSSGYSFVFLKIPFVINE
jgi:hypothetical protein